jgi:hypothetical protein
VCDLLWRTVGQLVRLVVVVHASRGALVAPYRGGIGNHGVSPTFV